VSDFCLDGDVTDRMVPLLVARGHSVLTTKQAGLGSSRDDEQLVAATDRGRLLIIHNSEDFLLLYHAWRTLSRRWGAPDDHHAGILVVPQHTIVPYERSAREIDSLVRVQREVWGRYFSYDARWGWSLEP
jgi:Domain of unknown function (DUF5615)